MGIKNFFAGIFNKSSPSTSPTNADSTSIQNENRYINGSINADQYADYLDNSSKGNLKYNSFAADSQPIVNTNASNIHEIDLFGDSRDSNTFWNHHGHNKDDYYELASHIPEVQERLNAGENIESIYNDPDIGACARNYYDPKHMPRVAQYGDTYISQGDNRHRILAAQDQGYDIPVRVTGAYESNENTQTTNASSSQPEEDMVNQPRNQILQEPPEPNPNATNTAGQAPNNEGTDNQNSAVQDNDNHGYASGTLDNSFDSINDQPNEHSDSEDQNKFEGENKSEGQDETEGENEAEAGGESEGSDEGESSSPDSGGESAGNDYDYGYGY